MTVDVLGELRRAGVQRGSLLALVVAPSGAALAAPGLSLVGLEPAAAVVRAIDEALRPRWVLWSNETAGALVAAGTRIATSWDVAAAHRLLFGGWRAEPSRVWARLHDLPVETMPAPGPVDLFSTLEGSNPEDPVRGDGHLDAEWGAGAWAETPKRAARWAELALDAAREQGALIRALGLGERAEATVRSESTAELLCTELAADGLPIDRAAAEALIEELVGPRPRHVADADAIRSGRDRDVLRHVPGGATTDLRSPGQVKALLQRVGLDVPDTRAWRLETLRDAHPVVGALLTWRKAERVATTYGYSWLDRHLGDDGRLRGEWTGSDGAAGRMTASAGLHNLPADMRRAVVAEPGHAFVRADLGQIEPRVLAAVSGDTALGAASAADDMYAPIARELGVDRPTAKVAVLGAMYGQTTGHGATALRRLRATFPVAMAYLDEGDRAGRMGEDLRTYGGRRIRMRRVDPDLPEQQARSVAAAQGRYGRNALVQGAAAELFKAWAVTVRARARERALGATIVLCLHDELLVHVPAANAAATAALLDECLQEASVRWAPSSGVRFTADTGVFARWSDAKG